MTDDIIPLDEARRRKSKSNGAAYGDTDAGAAETIERLSQLSKLEYEAVRKDEAPRLNFRVSVFDDLVEAARVERKRAELIEAQRRADALEAQQQKEIEAALATSAAEIIDCEDVLGLFEADWRRLVAGEVKNAKILYLVATSRLLNKTMHAAVKGPSSAGKSEIRGHVLKFMPPESVISFTSLSERALIYNSDDFQHKILSMGEAAGAQEQTLQDYLLRELMSEGRLEYHTVQKVGDRMETITIVKDGPVAFLVTTTKNKLHPENETRMLSLEVDDSETQTRAVMAKVAEVEGLGATTDVVDFGPWHDFQRWLASGTVDVVLPFAPALADAIPARAVRLRRDLGQVLRAIKGHALLHRQHRELDERGRIVADLDNDYAAVRDLMHGLLQETSDVKIKETTLETIAAVTEATFGMGSEEGATCQAVAKILRLDKTAALRRLKVAHGDGFVVNLETRRGMPGKYRATDQSVESETMLPTLEALTSSYLSHSEIPATLQPQPKDSSIQTSCGLHDGLQPAPENSQPATAEQPGCNPDCNRQDAENAKESEDGCRVAQKSEGSSQKDSEPKQIDLEDAIAAANQARIDL